MMHAQPRRQRRGFSFMDAMARARTGMERDAVGEFATEDAMLRAMRRAGIPRERQAEIVRLHEEYVALEKYECGLGRWKMPPKGESLNVIKIIDGFLNNEGDRRFLKEAGCRLDAVEGRISELKALLSRPLPSEDAHVDFVLVGLARSLLDRKIELLMEGKAGQFINFLAEESAREIQK